MREKIEREGEEESEQHIKYERPLVETLKLRDENTKYMRTYYGNEWRT